MNSLNITDDSFSGDFVEDMITKATIGAESVNSGSVYVIDGIKKSKTIPRLDISNFVQDRNATPTPYGTITVDRAVLEPRDYMVYLEYNPRDYEDHWFEYQLENTLLDASGPRISNAFMVMQLGKEMAQWNEFAIWRSRTKFHEDASDYTLATAVGQDSGDQQYKYFNGLIHTMLNDATTLRPSGTQYEIQPGATFSGVTTNFYPFEQCISAMNNSEAGRAQLFKYGPEGFKFHVNRTTKLVYEEFLTSQSFKNNDTTEKGIGRYKGYDVVLCSGLPDNTVYASVTMPSINGNLFYGLNSKDDETYIKMDRVQANSELFFLKMLMKADATQGYGDLGCLYTTCTA